MDNLKSPAYPLAYQFGKEYNDDCINEPGFTKLALASLMIAQGLTGIALHYNMTVEYIANKSTEIAKAVLEEANK